MIFEIVASGDNPSSADSLNLNNQVPVGLPVPQVPNVAFEVVPAVGIVEGCKSF